MNTSVAAWGAAAAVLARCIAGPAPAVAQQTGTVQGRVVEVGTARPLANAQVQIQGTSIGALTNAAGRFSARQRPPGSQRLRVEMFGYAAATQEISVTASQPTTVEVELEVAAVDLDELVVTALGVERQRRAVPYAVAEVKAAEIAQAASVTTASAIYGKAAGVHIAQGASGPTGSINITIRGVKSITGS